MPSPDQTHRASGIKNLEKFVDMLKQFWRYFGRVGLSRRPNQDTTRIKDTRFTHLHFVQITCSGCPLNRWIQKSTCLPPHTLIYGRYDTAVISSLTDPLPLAAFDVIL